MPRYAQSQLRWSEQAQSYVLASADQASSQEFNVGWLEQIASFSFHSRDGMYYTVRKQKVQRGGSYWYAYRRLHGRIIKRYLGKTADLSLNRLEEIARLLESSSSAQQLTADPQQEMTSSSYSLSVPFQEDVKVLSPPEPVPLLLSKLAPPRLPGFLLDRSRLFTLLDNGQQCAITLLSAPAGFGKTTLVCQWIAARRTQSDFPTVAWVSLESADNDPLRFWRYLIATCQALQIDLQDANAALRALTPQPPFLLSEFSTMLTALLNALAQCPTRGILVLEDYHVITEQTTQETLSFFLEHLPTTLHVILISRNDPPFSLTLLRARNMLYEVRTSDLRFSEEESSILLHHALPFALDASTIQRLHAQLQGWGAGLHLMKLALQKTTTAAQQAQVLALFSQNNTSLQEYFVSEVLALQPEPVQQFILQTCLLTRLNSSLCNAVTQQENAQDLLTLLDHSDLFLEPLEYGTSQRPQMTQQWYRYHALFAEAMQAEAHRRFSREQLRLLSARASHWYETHSFPHEAIDVALSTQDYERAAILIVSTSAEHTFPGEIYEPHTLQRWLEQLPENILEKHPLLCLSYATTLLFQSTSWQPDDLALPLMEKLLHKAEQGFRVENNLSKLGELAAFRSLLALRSGDIQASSRYAKQALDWLAEGQHIWRGLTLSIVAEELLQKGHFQQAFAALLEAQALCGAAKNHYFQRIALLKLAHVYFEQGNTQQASALYRQLLADAQNEEPIYARSYALVGLASLCYACNDLESASRYAQEAIAISNSQFLVYYEVQAGLLQARILQAQGQDFVAQQQLSALLDRTFASLPHLAQEIKAAQAHLALSTGEHITMQLWAASRLPHPTFSQEIGEKLLISRWLRAQGKLDEAAHQLELLLAATQKAGQTRRILEIQVEMVLVAAARKQKTEALQLLQRVLGQALASNLSRMFLDAGEQMATLLRLLIPQLHEAPLLTFVRTILRAFPGQSQNGTLAPSTALLEPLSPQEKRVLRLLAQHRSNADIASELVVSVNTVRTQVQSIYGKLGVHNRSAASAVAHELHLI
ncbi:hypothetical protein EPA93_12770 [Ktedonosporobacter rubrisoli]|uniref:HTH luxR-type domain-containing protein n=1 Tax=Ktedonosporobacter rubrisoli TaxID=2509675 RepID=A0A4P6JNE7_KTERU|nr:LuxR C-terminal-related transcriptional regulator [Ktedonosporobacter rubrisoli]QBD76829.1 hypothetical protein EPA93_12770 [Ktedonosporobacter rubrisoli]